jgi:hypothetical protein
MNDYMLEIVAREWLREWLQNDENDRVLRAARRGSTIQAGEALPRPARRANITRRLGMPARGLVLAVRRLAFAIRRLARVTAAS